MFLIIFKVLYIACFHGANKAIAPTWAQNEGVVTLNAYNTTNLKVQIRTISFASTLIHIKSTRMHYNY